MLASLELIELFQVMYFTATSPYVLMVILLIRGLTLEGCLEGLKFYLIPDFARLLDPQVVYNCDTYILLRLPA